MRFDQDNDRGEGEIHQQLDIAIAICGAVILGLGLVAGYVKNRWWVSEVTLCMLLGVALGPLILGLADAEAFDIDRFALLEEVARLTLGLAVMGAALRLPGGFIQRYWRSIAITLCVGMPLMWLTASALAVWLLPVTLTTALLIGAVLAPTDPVMAASIVSGNAAEMSVPERLRYALAAESGANDGLGMLFVMLPVLLLEPGQDAPWLHWATIVLLWEICVAVLIGALIGWLAGKALLWSYRQPTCETHSTVSIGLALSLTVLTVVDLMQSDGILAVFAAGVVFNRFVDDRETRHEHLQAAIGRFFDLPVFVLFGLMIPWHEWMLLGWSGLAFVAAALLVRRLPWWLLLRPALPWLHTRTEAAFAGWFGPVGIASIYYALMSDRLLQTSGVWTIASAVVFASALAHGISATPLTALFGTHHDDAGSSRSVQARVPDGERRCTRQVKSSQATG